MDKRIKVLVLEGLTADDLLKLKAGGFFDGAAMPLPEGVQGQAATLKVTEPTVSKAEPEEVSFSGAVAVPAGALSIAQDAPHKMAQPEVPPAVAQVIETARQVGLDLVPAPEEVPAADRRKKAAPVSQGPRSEPTPVVAAPAAEAAPVAAQVAPDAVNLSALSGFAKLRDLLEYAHGAGVPAGQLIEWCLSVKNDVPLLSRIADIPGRVQRTVEVMGLVS